MDQKVINFFVEQTESQSISELQYLRTGADIFNNRIRNDEKLAGILIGPNDKDRLKGIINNLSEDTKFFIWFHLDFGTEGTRTGMNGIKNALNFQKVFPAIKEPHYFTTGWANIASTLDPKIKDRTIKFADINSYVKQNIKKAFSVFQFLSPNHQQRPFDWNLKGNMFNKWLFENTISEPDIFVASIIGDVFEKFLKEKEKPRVEVLTAGFSGAHVLKMDFDFNPGSKEFQRSVVIKVDKKRENLARELRIRQRAIFQKDLSEQVFLFPKEEPRQIFDRYVIYFNMATGKKPLKDQLGKTISHLKKVYDEVVAEFKKFENAVGELSWLDNEKPWHPTDEKQDIYSGLYLKKRKNDILVEIQDFKSRGFLQPSEVSKFSNFLKGESGFDGHTIGGKLIGLPKARIHGDFHASNILVDDNGKAPQFIDFALTPELPNEHAFLDLAKLSLDSEMHIIKDSLFTLKPKSKEIFDEWISLHKDFVNDASLANKTIRASNSKVKTAYQLNQYILQKALDYYHNFKPDFEKEGKTELTTMLDLKRHFLLCRLHYFLQMVSYTNILLEKRLFAAKACLHILNLMKSSA